MLQQLREELWELNDEETRKTISDYKNWDTSNSISMEDFIKKYYPTEWKNNFLE
jgi:hypothetical protein